MKKISIILTFLSVPVVSMAQEYKPLVLNFQGVTEGDIASLFNRLFEISLLLGSVLAVLMIALAGLRYMTTDATSDKKGSKEQIQKALIGLLMLLGIWVFYQEINPRVLELDFSLKPVNVTVDESSGPTEPIVTEPEPVVLTTLPDNLAEGVCAQLDDNYVQCGYADLQDCVSSSRSGSCAVYFPEDAIPFSEYEDSLHYPENDRRVGICGQKFHTWSAPTNNCGFPSLSACRENTSSRGTCSYYDSPFNSDSFTSYTRTCTDNTPTCVLPQADALTADYGAYVQSVDPTDPTKTIITGYTDLDTCSASAPSEYKASCSIGAKEAWIQHLQDENASIQY